MATDLRDRPKVLVYGAGAVGALLGGMLAARGCRVTLLGRARLRETIQHSGLRIDTPAFAGTVYPRVIESIDELHEPPDISLLTMRSFDVEPALPDLLRLNETKTTFVALQNGVGTDELLRASLPKARLLAGSLTISAAFDEPDLVRATSRSGGVALAPVTGDGLEQVAHLFTRTGIPVKQIADYRSMRWSKLLLNIMGNATGALLGWTPARVYAHAGIFALERAMLGEGFAVMRAYGIRPVSLPGFPVPLLERVIQLPGRIGQALLAPRMRVGRGEKMPSLYGDVERGNVRTEAAWLYGAIAAAGDAINLETPVNRRLLRLMQAVLVNDRLRQAFRDSPDRLIRNVVLGMDTFGMGRRLARRPSR
jgi:2-dehydropantoate 2-reductase